MHPFIRIVPALALVLACTGCSLMGHSDQSTNGSDTAVHQANSSGSQAPTGDEAVNCAPDKIGSAAGQGSNCRHGTGGAASTPPDSSNSNDPNAPTAPPHSGPR
jgi:hypothetical protein